MSTDEVPVPRWLLSELSVALPRDRAVSPLCWLKPAAVLLAAVLLAGLLGAGGGQRHEARSADDRAGRRQYYELSKFHGSGPFRSACYPGTIKVNTGQSPTFRKFHHVVRPARAVPSPMRQPSEAARSYPGA